MFLTFFLCCLLSSQWCRWERNTIMQKITPKPLSKSSAAQVEPVTPESGESRWTVCAVTRLLDYVMCDYRTERWCALLTDILSTALRCAYLMASVKDYILYCMELLGRGQSSVLNTPAVRRAHDNRSASFCERLCRSLWFEGGAKVEDWEEPPQSFDGEQNTFTAKTKSSSGSGFLHVCFCLCRFQNDVPEPEPDCDPSSVGAARSLWTDRMALAGSNEMTIEVQDYIPFSQGTLQP